MRPRNSLQGLIYFCYAISIIGQGLSYKLVFRITEDHSVSPLVSIVISTEPKRMFLESLSERLLVTLGGTLSK